MNEYQVAVIPPDAKEGVLKVLQTTLEKMDQGGWDLKAITPYRDGLLLILVRDALGNQRRQAR